MAGRAVADLTHLIAELLENATVFSPPHTAVQVLGERVANGFTLEIHDRGLGMTPDALLDANLRLAETPEFELSDTDRLGLFVVCRLAQRHGVTGLAPALARTAAPPRWSSSPARSSPRPPARTAGGATGRRHRHRRAGRDAAAPAEPRRPDRSARPATPRPRSPAPVAAAELAAVERRRLDGPVELEAPLDGPERRHRRRDPSAAASDGSAGVGRTGRRAAPAGTRTSRPAVPRAPRRGRARTGRRPDEHRPTGRPRTAGRARAAAAPPPGAPVLVSDHGRPVDGARPANGRPDGRRPARGAGAPRPPRAAAHGPGRGGERLAGAPPPPRLRTGARPAGEHRQLRAACDRPASQAARSAGPAGKPGAVPAGSRQASLAPQLSGPDRDRAPKRSAASRTRTERDAERGTATGWPPLQRGWRRGTRRATHAAPTTDGRHRSATAPGTTPEGDGR